MKKGESKTTTDLNEIKSWAEKRGGHPAVVIGSNKEETGILRIDFGESEESLEKISWEKFSDLFEKNQLAFLYQELTNNGNISRFFKFVNR